MILEVEKNGKKKSKKMAASRDGASAKPAKTAAGKTYIVIDHPQEGETLGSHHHYAIRLGASSGPVEISIDGSDWKSCRHAAGYYWYDWSSISSGPHKLVARMQADGKEKKSRVVKCKAK